MICRTDLALECMTSSKKCSGIEEFHRGKYFHITEIRISEKEASERFGKPEGNYITLEGESLSGFSEHYEEMAEELANEIRALLPDQGDILVAGLGNAHITPDALGYHVTEKILATRHLQKELADEEEAFLKHLRPVSVIAGGVLGQTGIESAEWIKAAADLVTPSAVIAIDALAARESARICTTIQITDTGIRPGSGVGNHREGLNRDTLGVPVIAIGVPMVVYAAVIARDALTLLMEDMAESPEEHGQAIDALVDKITKQKMGELVVTPREVDEMVGKVARIIADGLNLAFQPRLTEEEITALSHDRI